jgi:N-methylhydantoinase A/oxoprolinase/acetone carboxylase beta subunit
MNRIGIDIGGTFTDLVFEKSGEVFSKKILTTPNNPETAALEGIHTLLNSCKAKLSEIDTIIHGTTIAANALIERKGAKTALVTTKGFRDVLEMRYEKRFDQYDLNIQLPEPLVPRNLRFGLNERILVDGKILKKPNINELNKVLKECVINDIEAVAVAFLHSYANPKNEQYVAKFLRKNLPSKVTVCISSDISPEAREFERFSTTVANAYVRPLMSNYIDSFNHKLNKDGFKGSFLLLSSSGGLTSIDHAKRIPIRLVESGPAGGIILANKISNELKEENSIALDIGGTTAKICYLDRGEPVITRRFEVARAWKNKSGSGLPLRIPAMDLVEIGAGGGSIARQDSLGRLTVGPESASSKPGPACYNMGGTNPTVTDANLLLGRISKETFAGGSIALSEHKSKLAIIKDVVTPLEFKSISGAASGIVEIGEELMANAARIHGIELGKNIRDFSLVASGGGGPIHAVGIAEKLDIDKVIIPHLAGVGSALGFLYAPISYEIAQSFSKNLNDLKVDEIKKFIDKTKKKINKILITVGAKLDTIEFNINAELRYQGQGHEFSLPLSNNLENNDQINQLVQCFIERYREKFGFSMPENKIELVSIVVLGKSSNIAINNLKTYSPNVSLSEHNDGSSSQNIPVYDNQSESFLSYAVFNRERLPENFVYQGPCVICEQQTTTVIPKNWNVFKNSHHHLILTRVN